MAKKLNKKTLTAKDISKMSTAEVLNELLFESYFISANGPVCKCYTSVITHFLGKIPDKLCGKNIDEVDLKSVPDFETEVAALCPCQLSHYYKLKLEGENLSYEVTEGRNMDERRLRLPNY